MEKGVYPIHMFRINNSSELKQSIKVTLVSFSFNNVLVFHIFLLI